MTLLVIENDDQRIVATNYWESEYAASWAVFLSTNAGGVPAAGAAPPGCDHPGGWDRHGGCGVTGAVAGGRQAGRDGGPV